MQVLHDKLKKAKDAVVLALNVGDQNDKVVKYWKEKGYGFPTLQDADSLAGKYGIKAFPSAILIDPEGKVVAAQVGSVTQLESALREAREKASL